MSDHVTNWLSAYYDGELTGRQLRRVEAHLADCAACRAELDQLQTLSVILQASPALDERIPPDQFVAQVGLRLPRRPERPARQSVALLAWWLAPLLLLGVWVFLQTLLIVTGLTRVAVDLGLGGEVASMWLPVESGSILQAARLNLLLSGVVALSYLSWLASWWSRRHQENVSN